MHIYKHILKKKFNKFYNLFVYDLSENLILSEIK